MVEFYISEVFVENARREKLFTKKKRRGIVNRNGLGAPLVGH